jgi:hypothetical protein
VEEVPSCGPPSEIDESSFDPEITGPPIKYEVSRGPCSLLKIVGKCFYVIQWKHVCMIISRFLNYQALGGGTKLYDYFKVTLSGVTLMGKKIHI